MKKISLLTMLLFIMLLAHGQHKAKFGLKVGVAVPSIVGAGTTDTATINDYKSRDYKPTLSGGFYINTEAGEYFWFKHEVNYVNRGYNVQSGGNTLRTNQHYIDVYPLNATLHIKGFQLMVGPSISFLAVKTYETINSSNEIEVKRSDLDNENRNLAELGVVAGLEYEFPFGLNLGARFVRGLTSQYQPIKNQPQVKVFSQTLVFSLGFTFGANKKPASSALD